MAMQQMPGGIAVPRPLDNRVGPQNLPSLGASQAPGAMAGQMGQGFGAIPPIGGSMAPPAGGMPQGFGGGNLQPGMPNGGLDPRLVAMGLSVPQGAMPGPKPTPQIMAPPAPAQQAAPASVSQMPQSPNSHFASGRLDPIGAAGGLLASQVLPKRKAGDGAAAEMGRKIP